MKSLRLFALLLAALFALLTPRPAEARVEASFDFFYDSLSPYGEWVQVADYGICWRPTEVDDEWSPYSDGYWAFTDAGWTWVSYEDFGGIVYHYGRWVRTDDAGWCWVPDYEWGPAWVSWRNNDDYVGWAPLPPEARWQPSIGISVWADRDYDIGPDYYSFCHVRDFGAPVLRPVIINRIENVTIIRRTVNITNITYNTHYSGGPVIYNGGPSFTFINERSSRRIPALKLVQNTNIDLAGFRDGNRGDRRRNFNGQAVGNQLVVTAPFVRPPTDPGFLRPQVKRVIAADRVSRGWGKMKNDEVRRELRQEMQQQTRGATRDSAPARAVAVNDLKVLPAKADPQAPSPVADRDSRGGRDRDGRGDRDGRDRPDRKPTAVSGQPPVTPPGENGTLTNRPPTATPTDDRNDQNRGRGSGMRNPQAPVTGDSTLRPFNPGNDPDSRTRGDRGPGNPGVVPPAATRDPSTAQPGEDGNRRRNPEAETGRMNNERADQEKARQQGEAATAAREQQQKQQQQQMDVQRQAEAQRKADGLRQQQEAAAAAGRQRMQAEQEKAARQPAEPQGAEQQRRMPRDRGTLDNQQPRRAPDAERDPQRRPQADAGADQQRQAEALRRQAMEQQQRGQREAAEQARRAQDGQREAAEQARRAQEGQQRQQMDAQRQQQNTQRPQNDAQRPQRREQAQPQRSPTPQTAPPSGNPAEAEDGRRRKRD